MRPRTYSTPAERQRAYRERKKRYVCPNVTPSLYHEEPGVRFYHGDARHMSVLAAESVHLVACSPPYFNARQEYATWPSYAAYLADMTLVWAECYRVLVAGGRIAVNVPDGYGRPGTGGYLTIGDDTARALVAAGFALRGKVIWDKGPVARSSTAWGTWCSASNPSLRDGHEVVIIAHKGPAGRPGPAVVDRETFTAATVSIWQIPVAPRRWHPAPWPAELARRLIALYSFPGDVVLDPFAGSGTTVWVAQTLGRLGIGIELSAEYLRQAIISRRP